MNNLLKVLLKVLSLTILIGLSGCVSSRTVNEYEMVNLKTHIVERPAQLKLKPIEFVVKDGVLMTFKSYENLSLNLQDIIQYIKYQNNIIEYYENMIRNSDDLYTTKEN